MALVFAAKLEDLQTGPPNIVTLDGKEIGLFQKGGQVFAVLNYCPHKGAPVCRGELSGAVVSDAPGAADYDAGRAVLRCPWHHWEFDLETGRALAPVRQRLKLFPVVIEGPDIFVETGNV